MTILKTSAFIEQTEFLIFIFWNILPYYSGYNPKLPGHICHENKDIYISKMPRLETINWRYQKKKKKSEIVYQI